MGTPEQSGKGNAEQEQRWKRSSRRPSTGQRRGLPGRGIEPLEDRRLLALANLLPQYTDPMSGEQSALWNPKQAQFGKVDQSLFRTAFEHRHRIFTDDGSHFAPSDPEIMVAGGYVVVDAQAASARGEALQAEISQLGGQITGAFGDIVSAFVPLNRIEAFAALDSLSWASPAHAPATNAGLVTSQGDAAMFADAARALGVDGSGVKVGLISDSFNRLGGYPTDLANGEFPTPVTTVVELPPLPGIVPHDEGRALAQIVADVAPGAAMFFNTGVAGIGSFFAGMTNLREEGVDLIIDDLIYLTEPMYQDGALAQAIKASTDAGVAHFSSAGNYGDRSAEFGAFIDSGLEGVNGGILHDFDTGPSVDAFQKIRIPVGKSIRLSFQWDEPFEEIPGSPGVPSPGSASDVDILLVNAAGDFALTGGVNLNVGRDPVEIFSFFNDGTIDFDEDGVPDEEFNIAIELFFGPAPGRMKYIDFNGGIVIEEYSTSSWTSFGHFGAEGVFGVAAAPYFESPGFGTSPAILNEYSSLGRQVILFDPSGNRLAEPIIRHHPDATGPDQGDTSFFVPGIDIEPNGLPNFPGTSAAAPHVGAVAALMLEAAGGPGSLSVQSLYTGLKYTAEDILQRNVDAPEDIPGGLGYDYFSGHGFVNAEAAVAGALSGFDLVIDANRVAGDASVNDGNPADDGLADTFTVSLDGAEVVVVINGIEAARMDLGAVNTLTIVGSSDDDELVVDLSGGNPLPAGGFEFQAGADAGSGDRIRWFGGAQTNVIHTVAGLDAGTTEIDGAIVSFSGVELVSDLLTPVHREIRLGDASHFATLTDGAAPSDGVNRLVTSGTAPSFDFAGATGETQLIFGAASDQAQIDPLDALAAASIEVLLGDGDDQLFMVPQTAADLHLDGGPQSALDELFVNALDAGVTDTGAALQFIGFVDASYTDFEKLSISNAGEGGGLPDITVNDLSLAEGSAGGFTAMTFTVTLSVANPNQSVFVDYFTADGTAEDENGDNDYLSASGTLEFPPNTLEQTITIQVVQDTNLESNEQFVLHLANGVNANLLDESALGVIVNDDFPPAAVAYVDDDWAGVPLGEDPDGDGPAVAMGADAFAEVTDAVAAVTAGGSILIHAGDYEGVAIDKDLSLVALSSGVVIHGASPALTISAGNVSVTGVTLDTASDDVTALVTGGTLTLSGATVRETAAGAQAALRVTGGSVVLGTSGMPGLNTFEARGSGSLIDNQAATPVPALGNTWQLDGAALGNFEIEDHIEHAIDEASRGLVRWVADTLFVTALAPGDIDATHNNYRRLANMAAVLGSNTTAYLQGTFDFAEANALADWALGNDGVASSADDYAVVLPGGIAGVTVTAQSLGAATITGPGDLAAADLEGVFRLSDDDTHNWTISRLRIFDFDLAIDASRTTGNVDARDGLQLVDNHIRLAPDLNFDVAPIDFFQNIGIALGPGGNQTVRGNQIDIHGDSLSQGTQFAASVGIQSSPEGPTAYDGLLIENNTINVLSAQSVDPATIIGIWDAGLAHESDITIRGNQFVNLDAGNDPAVNLQRAFRVSSHSSAGTQVLYEGNTVTGANIGFQWQPNSDLSGHEPVELTSNVLSNVFRGIVVSSQGSAHISGNALTGLGSSAGIGIDVQQGSSASIDGGVNDNSILNFSRGIFVKGEAEIVGNAATISGNAFGIDIDGGVATISGNRINANDVGIRITDGGAVTSITNNFIVDNTTDGLRVTAAAGALGPIFNNSLSGSGERAIRNQSGELIDASGNWWGTNTSDGVDQLELGDVDFSPWLDTGTDIDGDATNGFQGDFSTLHVDDNSSQAGAVGLIQEGVSLTLSGGRLIIHNGRYRESNATVDRPLTITGESRSGVVIAPGGEDDHTDTAFGGDYQQGFIIQSSDVTIQTLTIDGEANNALTPGRNNFRTGIVADRRTGVVYHRSRIENVEILHVWRRGIELFSSEAPDAPRSVDNIVRGNSIEDVTEREAILVREANALISQNTIQRARIGIGANDRGDFTNAPVVIIQQNTLSRVNQGVVLSGAANGSLVGGLGLGNLIDLTERDTADVGVVVQFSQGQVAVAGNTILARRGDAGVWLFHNQDATRPIVVANNEITSTQSSSDDPGRGVGVFVSDEGGSFGAADGASYANILSNAISGFVIGVDVDGGAAEIVGNGVNNNDIGVRVAAAGVALLEDNDLTDNDAIGLLIETGGVVDAGQEGIGTDFTGFGVSHGGNDFSSYADEADENAGAIVNRTEDNVAGRQGVPPDVSARGNLFFSTATADIETVIYHDVDDSDLGFVDFFGLQNLTFAFDTNPVNENAPVTLNGTFENVSADPHEVTINWGDGDTDVITVPAGVFAFSVMHTYEDDNPTGTASDAYPVLVTVAETTGPASITKATSITVANVAPVATIDGAPAESDLGVQIDLTGLVSDVGTQDTHTLSWEVLRNGEFFASGDGTAFSFTPTEAGSYQVTLTVIDDDLGEDTDVVTIEVAGPPLDVPAIAQVLVASTEWQPSFLALLGGDGYAIPSGGDQWAVLPWSNLNQIQIVFSEDVTVEESSLSIAGENVSSYGVAAFAYDPLTFTATWTLTDTFDVELVSLTLSDTIIDVDDGLALDGEWANGVSAFPSGDATAGGAFQFSFRVLPGDTDRNGEVGITDLNVVRNTFGDATNDIFHDLSGNGSIDIADLNAVRNFFGELAIAIPPPPIVVASSGNAADLLFTLADDDGGDGWWNEDDATDMALVQAGVEEPWQWALDDSDEFGA